MSYTSRYALPLCAAGCMLAAAAQEAPKPQLTARELFYSAASAPAPPSASTPAATPAPAAKAPPKPAPKKATSAPARAVTSAPVQTTTAAPATTAGGNQPAHPVSTHVDAGRAPIIPVVAMAPSRAPAPSTGTALGLKYTILRRSGSDMVEVPQDT